MKIKAVLAIRIKVYLLGVVQCSATFLFLFSIINKQHFIGQWTPWKKDGLKVYAREFLLAMSKYQASLKKPDNLPGDILKIDQGRVGDISRFSMGSRSTDFAPNFGNNSYPNKSSSQRGVSSPFSFVYCVIIFMMIY